MGRKTARTHAQGDDSRRRILEATLQIAAQRGYDGTTVARVTEATGLPASSIYWHFGSKDELLADVLEYSFREWRPTMPAWREEPTGEPLAVQLEPRMRGVVTGLAREPEFWRLGLMLALERRPREPAARRRFLHVRAEVTQLIAGWWRRALGSERLRNDVDMPLLAAQFTLAGLDGLFVASQIDPGLAADADRLARMVAWGLDTAAERLTAIAAPRPAAPAPPPAEPAPDAPGRDRILLAAAAVAAERGYEGTTISRICARAGLPASSLYWAYKDKDDLLAAVVEHSYHEWLAEQPGWAPIPEGASWPDELRWRMTASIASLDASPNFLRIGHMLALERRGTPPAGRDIFLHVRTHARDLITEWFSGVLDPDLLHREQDLPRLLSQLVMAFTDGLFLGLQMDQPAWDAAVAADLLIAVLKGAVQEALEAAPA